MASDAAPASPRPIAAIRDDAKSCRRCPLWAGATQTVFGAGAAAADVVLVGEQPGDQEDVAGEPFVGPAGQLLRKALAAAGLDERRLYLTNAVKHFKWVPRGKRRLHERPNTAEILACQIWLELELRSLRPRLIVAMGATALRALLGPSGRVTRDRGRTFARGDGASVLVTVHVVDPARAGRRVSPRGLRGVREGLESGGATHRARGNRTPPWLTNFVTGNVANRC